MHALVHERVRAIFPQYDDADLRALVAEHMSHVSGSDATENMERVVDAIIARGHTLRMHSSHASRCAADGAVAKVEGESAKVVADGVRRRCTGADAAMCAGPVAGPVAGPAAGPAASVLTAAEGWTRGLGEHWARLTRGSPRRPRPHAHGAEPLLVVRMDE